VGEVRVLDDLSSGLLANLAGVDVALTEETILGPIHARPRVRWSRRRSPPSCSGLRPRSLDDPLECHQVNATGTLLVLESTRRVGVGHVVLASSASVYGSNPSGSVHEHRRPEPVSPYAASKLAAEGYALAYAHCFGLNVRHSVLQRVLAAAATQSRIRRRDSRLRPPRPCLDLC
jgi:UDP-glucose 4-epimerase